MAEKVQLVRNESGTEYVQHPETEIAQVEGFEEGVQNALNNMNSAQETIVLTDDYSYRPSLFTVGSDKVSVIMPKGLRVVVNGRFYQVTTDTTVPIPSTISAANRAGKDLYIYACENSDINSTTPVFVISMDSTYPSGYGTDTSRKIGGFHCLCSSVGTVADHPLSGYVTGNILPASRWDLIHRPQANPEGMVYDENLGIWVDIYLSSVSGTTLQSLFGGVTADGGSTVKFHFYKFVQWLARTKKRLPYQHEFMHFALGSPEGVSIKNSADPNTTGAHTSTNDKRIISNIGCEDCCGVPNQWGLNRGGGGTGSGTTSGDSWKNAYDANDDGAYGQHYAAPNCILLGGIWEDGARCGSRFSNWRHGPLDLDSKIGARGVSEPKSA